MKESAIPACSSLRGRRGGGACGGDSICCTCVAMVPKADVRKITLEKVKLKEITFQQRRSGRCAGNSIPLPVRKSGLDLRLAAQALQPFVHMIVDLLLRQNFGDLRGDAW